MTLAIPASTLLGRLSTRFRNVFMGSLGHSSRGAFVRSDMDVGWKGLVLHSNTSHSCSVGLRSGLRSGQSISSSPNWLHWERPILSRMSVETVCMPRCLVLYTCGHRSDWNIWFQWVNTFGNIVQVKVTRYENVWLWQIFTIFEKTYFNC